VDVVYFAFLSAVVGWLSNVLKLWLRQLVSSKKLDWTRC